MILNTYLTTMSRYNRWQNQEIFAAADVLSENERQQERGAFWHSIHGTLSHLYWADRIWGSRFEFAVAPDVSLKQSAEFVSNWSELVENRRALDDALVKWCDSFEDGPVTGNLKWFSGAAGRNIEAPMGVVLAHFFNHQTHHRGQAHAMISAAGSSTSDTDLILMPPEHWTLS